MNHSFSENIKIIRLAHNLTQKELAEKTGFSQQQISQWEKGEKDMRIKNLLVLCQVLNTEPKEFFK